MAKALATERTKLDYGITHNTIGFIGRLAYFYGYYGDNT
jgi:hypothetical protein